MNHLFGKKKEPAKAEPTTTDAVAKMDEVRRQHTHACGARATGCVCAADIRPNVCRPRARTRQHIDSMDKRAEFLQKKIDKELQNAKDCSKRKDKRGALMALKRKNLYVKVRAAGRCALARSTRSLLRPGWADTDPKDHTRAALHRSKRSL